jgi:hypothetical protein
VDDGSSFVLHTLTDTSHPYVFIADLGKGTKLKNFRVQTSEESAFVFVKFSSAVQHVMFFTVFIARHLANGATQAFANDGDDLYCSEGYANCAGHCFGVCEIGRYCM